MDKQWLLVVVVVGAALTWLLARYLHKRYYRPRVYLSMPPLPQRSDSFAKGEALAKELLDAAGGIAIEQLPEKIRTNDLAKGAVIGWYCLGDREMQIRSDGLGGETHTWINRGHSTCVWKSSTRNHADPSHDSEVQYVHPAGTALGFFTFDGVIFYAMYADGRKGIYTEGLPVYADAAKNRTKVKLTLFEPRSPGYVPVHQGGHY